MKFRHPTDLLSLYIGVGLVVGVVVIVGAAVRGMWVVLLIVLAAELVQLLMLHLNPLRRRASRNDLNK
jgi:hypothetical protein